MSNRNDMNGPDRISDRALEILMTALCLAGLVAGGCGGASGAKSSSGEGGGTKGGTGAGGGGAGGAAGGGSEGGSGAGGSAGSGAGGGGGGPAAGTLTAGVWDDNLNHDFYLGYVGATNDALGPAATLDVPRTDRLTILVAGADGAPVTGARVVVRHGDRELFATQVGSEGLAYFYPAWYGVAGPATLKVAATLDGVEAAAEVEVGQAAVSLSFSSVASRRPDTMQVAFIVDTTGSMGDEMAYLKTEIESIATMVSDAVPGISFEWALVTYKDKGDAYVARHVDFTSSVTSFRADLAAERASGGGDYPEAVERGLAEATKLSWRPDGRVARVAFHLADAPHHAGAQESMEASIKQLRATGVHVYGIAASGVDELAELTMRSIAQLTGGRYLFLTDDSGVGGAHKEPTLPCYVVTRLDRAIVRMLRIEAAGAYVPVDSKDVIRTGGNPEDGVCKLPDGTAVEWL